MTEIATPSPAHALLIGGTQIEIRPLCPQDEDAVRDLYRGLSAESLYLRFFGFSRDLADRAAARVCREDGFDHAALGAWLLGDLVGLAQYEPTDVSGTAEVAMAVADHMHHRGVGTLLLEHLASLARSRGIRAFHADTLLQNSVMLRVFADAGLLTKQTMSGGVVELDLPLEQTDRYLDAVAERERRSAVESMEPLLEPASVVVVGPSRKPGSVGGAVLRHIRDGGFQGRLFAVNPHAGDELDGVVCLPSVTALPIPPDLAVITVPAATVAAVADDCGRRGVRSLLVITSGLTRKDGLALRATCHRYGMRLVGPNCLGLDNPRIGLDATFAARSAEHGAAGVVVQSGGVGIALLDHLSDLGIGVSTFASVGDKYDISGNDMLMWWESDPDTTLGVLYLESFGNPRKFSRTARRVSRRIPLLTVIAGRSETGLKAAASHTAAAASPGVTRKALFTQAGVIATDSLGELVETAALLAHQPYPRGSRVAIVSNAGGAGVLAADACADAGLTVPQLSEKTRHRLAGLLPSCAAVANPVDTTAAISPEQLRRTLELVAADADIDALLVLIAPTALGDLVPRVPENGKPVAAVRLGQPEMVRIGEHGIPTYAFPENAARALAHACGYAHWRTRDPGTEPVFTDTRPGDATEIIESFLGHNAEGGWLPPVETLRLLETYGLPVAPWRWVRSAAAAVRAGAELGGHVVLKAHVPGLVHKSDAGAVQLDLRGSRDIRAAYTWLTERFGDRLEGVLVQPMAADGVEVLCGIVQEQVFGPLEVFGLGGVNTEVLSDRSARLAPLTDVDADELIDDIGAVRLLHGHRGRPPVDLAALRDVLLRLSRLATDHPEIAELDLNPVIARPDGVLAVDARIRLHRQPPYDPYLRRLP